MIGTAPTSYCGDRARDQNPAHHRATVAQPRSHAHPDVITPSSLVGVTNCPVTLTQIAAASPRRFSASRVDAGLRREAKGIRD